MRRALGITLGAISLSLLVSVSAVNAQEGVEGTGSLANEGHPMRDGEEAQCTASSSDEACLDYWEHHINWFSWDYKQPYAQPEHRHMPAPFGFALLNFLIFAGILYRLAAQPLKDFVRTRHTTIRRDLDEAAQLHKEAAEKLREYEAKIAGLDREIDELLSNVRAEAEAEKARIVASAEAQAERLQKDAEAQIAREVQRVQRELKQEAAAQAVALAETVLKSATTDGDQVKLAERFVSELERPAAATRS